jgi:phage baseplate assembly protein W
MAVQRISRSFKDISLSFVPHPVTKDLAILSNENAIIRSVRNLVETIPTERFFNSTLGSNVRSILFDFVDYGTASVIKTEIENTIKNYEQRVNNVQIIVNPQPDQNNFEIVISFEIIGQQIPAQQFTFLLEATR